MKEQPIALHHHQLFFFTQVCKVHIFMVGFGGVQSPSGNSALHVDKHHGVNRGGDNPRSAVEANLEHMGVTCTCEARNKVCTDSVIAYINQGHHKMAYTNKHILKDHEEYEQAC